MPRPRKFVLPTGDETTTPARHLASFGACSPRNSRSHLQDLGVDPAGIDLNDTMVRGYPTETRARTTDNGTVMISDLARALCARCPIAEYCLEYAIDNPAIATDGIWGGLDPDDRRRLRRRQREQTRRKKARASSGAR